MRCILVVASFLCSAAVAADSFVDARLGRWEEVKGVSGDYQSIRRTYESLGGGLTRMVVNDKLDAIHQWHVDFRCDATRYEILGHDDRPVGQYLTCRRRGERVFEMSLVRTGPWMGKVDITRVHESVSDDGERMNVVAFSRRPDGNEKVVYREFNRIH
ncbi:MAG: hypothetical protein ABW136_07395 [Steroidobacteraceae bacterium]